MTEQIKSAISELETIRDNYDWRDYVTDESYDDCLNKAIRSLKAWEEVIKELEEMKCEYDCTTHYSQCKLMKERIWDAIRPQANPNTQIIAVAVRLAEVLHTITQLRA